MNRVNDPRHDPRNRQTKFLPRYDYKCVECGARVEREFREATFIAKCGSSQCQDSTAMFKRVFSRPNIKPMMHEHFNSSVGRPISDMNQYREVLKRTSDEMSEHADIEHNFQPLEYGDHQAFGATGEGIYESNVTRSREGNEILPLIDG